MKNWNVRCNMAMISNKGIECGVHVKITGKHNGGRRKKVTGDVQEQTMIVINVEENVGVGEIRTRMRQGIPSTIEPVHIQAEMKNRV